MSSIDIIKLSCGGSGYIEQVIESAKKINFGRMYYMLGNLLLKKTKTKIGQTFLPIQFG